MRYALAFLIGLGTLACTPMPRDDAPKPNGSEGTSYHLAGGTTLMKCNNWGFETICRPGSAR